MVPLVLSKINSQHKKKALNVEAVMEEHPHIIERVHLYNQTLYVDEYIIRFPINVDEKFMNN